MTKNNYNQHNMHVQLDEKNPETAIVSCILHLPFEETWHCMYVPLNETENITYQNLLDDYVQAKK